MSNPFDPIDLQQELAKYRKALEEEWETLNDGKSTEDMTPGEIRLKAKDLFTKAIPSSVATLSYLANHAKSETVRLNAATRIIDYGLGKDTSGLAGDPVEELLKSINAKAASS